MKLTELIAQVRSQLTMFCFKRFRLGSAKFYVCLLRTLLDERFQFEFDAMENAIGV